MTEIYYIKRNPIKESEIAKSGGCMDYSKHPFTESRAISGPFTRKELVCRVESMTVQEAQNSEIFSAPVTCHGGALHAAVFGNEDE